MFPSTTRIKESVKLSPREPWINNNIKKAQSRIKLPLKKLNHRRQRCRNLGVTVLCAAAESSYHSDDITQFWKQNILGNLKQFKSWTYLELVVGLPWLSLERERQARWHKRHKQVEGTEEATAHGIDYAGLVEATECLDIINALYFAGDGALDGFLANCMAREEDVEHFQAKSDFVGLAPMPAHVLFVSRELQAVVLCIRGTEVKDYAQGDGRWLPVDVMADLAASPVEFLDGYAHQGMATAARKLVQMHVQSLQTLEARTGYGIHVIGHSLGAGIAALTTLILQRHPSFKNVRCTAFGCPSVVSEELARKASKTVRTFVAEDDIVPRLSLASLVALHDELNSYDWQRGARDELFRAQRHVDAEQESSDDDTPSDSTSADPCQCPDGDHVETSPWCGADKPPDLMDFDDQLKWEFAGLEAAWTAGSEMDEATSSTMDEAPEEKAERLPHDKTAIADAHKAAPAPLSAVRAEEPHSNRNGGTGHRSQRRLGHGRFRAAPQAHHSMNDAELLEAAEALKEEKNELLLRSALLASILRPNQASNREKRRLLEAATRTAHAPSSEVRADNAHVAVSHTETPQSAHPEADVAHEAVPEEVGGRTHGERAGPGAVAHDRRGSRNDAPPGKEGSVEMHHTAKQSDLEESPMAWWGDAEALGSSKDDLSVWELAGLEAAKTTVTDEVLEAEEELVSLAVEHSLELLEEHFGTKYEREPLVHTWQQRYVGKTMAWIMSAARELVEHRSGKASDIQADTSSEGHNGAAPSIPSHVHRPLEEYMKTTNFQTAASPNLAQPVAAADAADYGESAPSPTPLYPAGRCFHLISNGIRRETNGGRFQAKPTDPTNLAAVPLTNTAISNHFPDAYARMLRSAAKHAPRELIPETEIDQVFAATFSRAQTKQFAKNPLRKQ
ncbi:hypothetical protein CYMTET_52205 [Cymbomonas tetramitiformis]|uniref:Fungal lipase-type domain-containing protein n=1 Tax=Cymbomonas tetramitiformis TaxID=36881 RepID=A0AAE0ER11_9CHLO|nr:hypothetical protein CYMTET_52205 [Cymbomonas tetramitiformis]